ncbi:MAG TPA: long-chain fatty acid--CoA ligase [Solirubrobacteraceae bacterium]|jgi:long-chain acyl-CoA synthetase|nr:long-chain fatty acid--CoA ligase [Solirubrobacteraceae bacterium]
MNLAENLSRSAAAGPDAPAVKLGDAVLSYAALQDASARVAGLLAARGVEAGDRVGIMLPNVPYFPVVYYGILRHGAVAVPMNVLLKGRETAFYLKDPGAKVVFAWSDFAEHARTGAAAAGAECIDVAPGAFEELLRAAPEPEHAVAPRGDGDSAVILYTSGTTGTPKGAELRHGNLARNCEAAIGLFTIGPETVTLGALPLFHTFGQTCAMNATLTAGGCLTLIPRFDPATALNVIERDRVSVFEGVPTMYGAMLHDPSAETADVSSLQVCACGGASLPVALMRAFEERFGCVILEGYGLSETSPVASFNHPGRPRKPGSIGTPIAGVEMKVVSDAGDDLPVGDVGEIVIRGHNVMKGYFNRPEATAEAIDADGWFHSGDLARVDEDGYFFIVDRKKDLIIRGGYNVYPREIEEVLYEHPAVREAAVVRVPHDDLGEEVGAAVVLEDGAVATTAELRAFVKDQVAAYKYPRHVWLVDELPKGPTGKILKRQIELPAEAPAQ